MEGPPEFGGIHPEAGTYHYLPQKLQLQQQHPHHSQFQLQVQPPPQPPQPPDLTGTPDQWPPAFGFPHSPPTPSSFQHSPLGPVPPFPLIPTSMRTGPVPPSPGTLNGMQRLPHRLSPPHNYLVPVWTPQSIPQQGQLHSIPFQQLPPPLSPRPHSYSAYCGSLRDQLFHPPYQPHIPFQQPVMVQSAPATAPAPAPIPVPPQLLQPPPPRSPAATPPSPPLPTRIQITEHTTTASATSTPHIIKPIPIYRQHHPGFEVLSHDQPQFTDASLFRSPSIPLQMLPGPSNDSPTPKDTNSPTTVDPKSLFATTKTTPLERKELAGYKDFTAKAAGTSKEEINEIVVSPTISIKPRRKRKRRTAIDPWVKEELEAEFEIKKKPTQLVMSLISIRLGVEKEYVRMWFCNRRQRQKKRDQELSKALQRAGQSTVEITVPSTTVKIPSPNHEIIIEAPSSATADFTQGQYACSYN